MAAPLIPADEPVLVGLPDTVWFPSDALAGLADDRFHVWIIPHTREHTNLQAIQTGDLVNLEFDVLAKYVERILGRTQLPPPHFTDRDLS